MVCSDHPAWARRRGGRAPGACPSTLGPGLLEYEVYIQSLQYNGNGQYCHLTNDHIGAAVNMGTVASSLLAAAAGQVPAQAEGPQLSALLGVQLGALLGTLLGALLGVHLGSLLGLEGRGPRPVAQLVTLSL